MALIKCPECEKEISDKAKSCPNCGYPLDEQTPAPQKVTCKINGTIRDLTKEAELCREGKEREARASLQQKYKLDFRDSFTIVELIQYSLLPKEYNSWLTYEYDKMLDKVRPRITYSAPVPKCPTCGSTNIASISGMERALSVGTLGLLSTKINKTFKCRNCGNTW